MHTETTGSALRSVELSVTRTRFSRDATAHPSVAWLAYDVADNGTDTGLAGYGDSPEDAKKMLDVIRDVESPDAP